ncbi:hypothetical protein BN14_01510 [Rhizoctonia solani AG-1 IB]|uniref:Uncharacterized protein n=1 Tax=Thanatephorus cucumeris (strain AG1-IB / isolate 7/3/14) TaxID=1108050 RepID=M5BMS3_THACB|nr:hypothetical protein BN14_01510 [Rhizoctonia solani AG-1 IB]
MSQSDTESRTDSYYSSDHIFKSFDGRISAKRPREGSISPALSSSVNVASARGMEHEESLLSLSDLIRPLSATPSPEPSISSGASPHAKGKETIGFESELFDGTTLDERMSPGGEDSDELMDDTRVAEVRKMILAWGILSREPGSDQSSGSRERQLAMMVMALTHPTRPTASQIAAQAEHIRSLLAERTDLSNFRHADRLSFERTAQALKARTSQVQQSDSKRTGGSSIAREAIYEDDRSRTTDSQVLQENLITENFRLEHDLQEAKREIAALKQSIEDLRVSILIRPHILPPSSWTSQRDQPVTPAPNPRGRPRKYPPVGGQGFQTPAHSTPGAQLPTSSLSILNTSTAGLSQPPPEKRMRGSQPDARAELLIAAARRVGKERVLKVLEGSEAGNSSGREELEHPVDDIGSRHQPVQHSPSGGLASYTELSPTNAPDRTAGRRGRPPRASISFPTMPHHQFPHSLVDEVGRSNVGRGRSSKLRATKSAQEASRTTLESSVLGDTRESAMPIPANQTPRRAQQVVVPFTGDPQVDAQTCLASFVAQYPGIQPAPMLNSAKKEVKLGLEDSIVSRNPQGNSSSGTVATERYFPDNASQVTPSRNPNDPRNHGLDHLLSAARTMLRARSQSASPTPQRQLTSNSTLASPHHISTRKRHSSSSRSHYTAPASRCHSSPSIRSGDSDTEPDEPESQGRQRVYSALDVLADQAAAARTSSPDPPIDRLVSSPQRAGRSNYPLVPFPVTPEPHATLLVPPIRNLTFSSPMTVTPASDPPQLSSSSTSPSTLDTVDNARRIALEEPFKLAGRIIPGSDQGGAISGLGGTASITNSVSRATTCWVGGHTEPTPISDEKMIHLEHPFTPPRLDISHEK